jgi:glycosyltransferase involved in cell wall biosynthesis
MKVAIVTCGLLDCLLPLAKYLSRHVQLDIYVSVYGDQFAESVGAFDLSELPTGMADQETSARVIGTDLMQYLNTQGSRIGIRLFKYPNLKVFNWQNIQLHRQFARELNSHQYDVVHFNGYRGSQMFLYAFLNRSIARVWTVHDPILHSGEDKWQTRLAYRSYAYMNAQFILHNRQQRPEFIQRYGISENRCHYVPFGPLEIFRIFENGQHIEEEPHTVLFWGRISPYKGVEYLQEAVLKIQEQIPDLKVIIAGKPNYPLDTTELDRNPVFEFINGYVPNPQLVRLIRRSALVVCPYTDATQSGVLMTAYAFGKPVLATAVGGIPEVVEEGVSGMLVPPRNADALANAMLEMLKNGRLNAMSSQIKEIAHTGSFSWEKIASDTLQVYEKAIEKRHI